MTGRVKASPASLDQVKAIVEFMERHPALALGQLQGLEGRDKSKKLWLKLTQIVNNKAGPVRPMKSWYNYWADKKSTVRAKVLSNGGDSSILTSNIEKKIWDLFLEDDYGSKSPHDLMESTESRNSMKEQTTFLDGSFFNDDGKDQNHVDVDPVLGFDEPTTDVEDRQTAIMGKISRPSVEQVTAIIDFMERHPALARGQLRGLEGKDESKKLWFKLTRIVNKIEGPVRSTRSWCQYWYNKKSTLKAKVQSSGGDSNCLTSNIEKKIWDLFVADEYRSKSPHGLVESTSRDNIKEETTFVDESFFNGDSKNQNHVDVDPVLGFDEPTTDVEDRQTAVMEQIVKVMSDQATALAQLAHATHVNAQAMERLADASQIQARAIDRLANTFETISGAAHDVRNAIVDIDVSIKRFYPISPI